MTENLRAFLKKAKQDIDFKRRMGSIMDMDYPEAKQALLAWASSLGMDLYGRDLGIHNSEMDDEDLSDVSGGGFLEMRMEMMGIITEDLD